MAWTNPIIGGNNELIRTSIKSPDYAVGISGWSINKDGSAEFNNVTVRGTLEAGPNVAVTSTGISVFATSPGGMNTQINNVSGVNVFGEPVAGGSRASLRAVGNSTTLGGYVELRPPGTSPNGSNTIAASLNSKHETAGVVDVPVLEVVSPYYNLPTSRSPAYVVLRGQSNDASLPARIELNGLVDGTDYTVTKETVTANVGTVAPNFTVVSVTGRKMQGGHIVNVVLNLTSTNAIAGAPNIADTLVFTLNAAWAPSEFQHFHYMAGSSSVGDVQVLSTGTVTIRNATVNIAAGDAVRMSFSYIKD